MLEAYVRAYIQDIVTNIKANLLPIVGIMLALILYIIAEY